MYSKSQERGVVTEVVDLNIGDFTGEIIIICLIFEIIILYYLLVHSYHFLAKRVYPVGIYSIVVKTKF